MLYFRGGAQLFDTVVWFLLGFDDLAEENRGSYPGWWGEGLCTSNYCFLATGTRPSVDITTHGRRRQ